MAKAVGSGSLGKKLFAGLQQYICGAQVSRKCEQVFADWAMAKQEVTAEGFETHIARITTDLAESASDFTDGIKRAIKLEVGNLAFTVAVSSFQEDRDGCLLFLFLF